MKQIDDIYAGKGKAHRASLSKRRREGESGEQRAGSDRWFCSAPSQLATAASCTSGVGHPAILIPSRPDTVVSLCP